MLVNSFSQFLISYCHQNIYGFSLRLVAFVVKPNPKIAHGGVNNMHASQGNGPYFPDPSPTMLLGTN